MGSLKKKKDIFSGPWGTAYEYNNRYLCSLKKECLPLLKQWRNAQMNVLRQYRPLTDHDQIKWFKAIKKDPAQAIFSLMSLNKQGRMEYIGYCGITYIDAINRRGELSFLVNPVRTYNKALYRKDFLAALYMLCWYGFEKSNLNKIFTETFAFRKTHIKILEEFGLCLEGRLRKYQLKQGAYHDAFIHSLLKDEWYTKKKKIQTRDRKKMKISGE